jgi:hypothetical protein
MATLTEDEMLRMAIEADRIRDEVIISMASLQHQQTDTTECKEGGSQAEGATSAVPSSFLETSATPATAATPAAPATSWRRLPVPRQFALVAENCLTEDECRSLIELAEAGGFEPALINVGFGRQILDDTYRNSLRHIRDDAALADMLWGRVKELVPATFKGRTIVEPNERLRFLKYGEGGFFQEHMDGEYVIRRDDVLYVQG